MVKKIFPKPRKRNIDLKEVRTLLKEINFTPENIFQEWRHVLAFGTFKGKKTVFKMASTAVTSVKTANEYNWNNAVHEVAVKFRPDFSVPANYFSGFYGKLFYFIAERYVSPPLITRDSKDLKNLTKFVPQIARVIIEIENLPISDTSQFALMQKIKNKKLISAGDRLLQSATEWASQVPLNSDPLLKVIADSAKNLRTSVAHGDFSPRQLYGLNGKIGVIDGEHAGLKGILYYDTAQFYLRLRNDHAGKVPAGYFLLRFKNLLKPGDKNSFWEELKPVLIQRYIGDLWGAAKNPGKLKELELLGKEILTDSILK